MSRSVLFSFYFKDHIWDNLITVSLDLQKRLSFFFLIFKEGFSTKRNYSVQIIGLSAGSDSKVYKFFFLSNACAANIKKKVEATNSKRSTKQEC